MQDASWLAFQRANDRGELLDPRQIDLDTPTVGELQSHGDGHGWAEIRYIDLGEAQRKW